MTIKPTQSYAWGSGDLSGDNTRRIFMTRQFQEWVIKQSAAIDLDEAYLLLRAFVREVERRTLDRYSSDFTHYPDTQKAFYDVIRDFGLEEDKFQQNRCAAFKKVKKERK